MMESYKMVSNMIIGNYRKRVTNVSIFNASKFGKNILSIQIPERFKSMKSKTQNHYP